MLDAARKAIEFTDGRERAALDDDGDPLVHALVHLISVIGEAANKVGPDARESLPDIRWQDMRGMRNRLVHNYFDINKDILWATVQQALPELIRQLEDALESDGVSHHPES